MHGPMGVYVCMFTILSVFKEARKNVKHSSRLFSPRSESKKGAYLACGDTWILRRDNSPAVVGFEWVAVISSFASGIAKAAIQSVIVRRMVFHSIRWNPNQRGEGVVGIKGRVAVILRA